MKVSTNRFNGIVLLVFLIGLAVIAMMSYKTVQKSLERYAADFARGLIFDTEHYLEQENSPDSIAARRSYLEHMIAVHPILDAIAVLESGVVRYSTNRTLEGSRFRFPTRESAKISADTIGQPVWFTSNILSSLENRRGAFVLAVRVSDAYLGMHLRQDLFRILALLILFPFLFFLIYWFLFYRLFLRPVKELTAYVQERKSNVPGYWIRDLDALRESLRASFVRIDSLNRRLQRLYMKERDKRKENEQLLIQQSKMAAMGEMVGAIAHQWRQPLNTLAILIQDVFEAHRYDELDENYITSFEKASLEQLHFMSRTIDDFRNFFKPSREACAFDVFDAIHSIGELLEAQLIRNDIVLDISCPDRETGEHPMAMGYPNEFKQVIVNLINNSREAILRKRAAGGEREGKIGITICKEKAGVVVRNLDNGGGIPDDVIEHIFEPYFTTREDGTGIGLYMSRMIVEDNMGGSLLVQNREGGAEFTIILPEAEHG